MVAAIISALHSSKIKMVKRGTASTKRGRKQASNPVCQQMVCEGSPLQQPPKETVARKGKGSFRGKLSHTSPILDLTSREKITVYFAALKSEDPPEASYEVEVTCEEEVQVPKSLALHRVFARTKCSPEKASLEPSPHKILMSGDVKSEVVEQLAKSNVEAAQALDLTAAKEPKVKATKAKRKLIVNQSLNQDASQNHKLTEYFAVRRSVRKPKTAILEEKQRYLEEAVESGKEDDLQIHNFPGKGRGIVANRLFRRGEFVVEYSGDLIDLVEARERERIYAADQNTGCYMYYFQHKNQSYCVDATAESHRLGRLVNHSRTAGNLIPKIIEIKDRPHLLLVARSDILPGEELLYDYGDRSRVSLKHHPWLAS